MESGLMRTGSGVTAYALGMAGSRSERAGDASLPVVVPQGGTKVGSARSEDA